MDIYEWFLGGMAPKKWIEALNRTVPSTFTDIDKRNEMMTKLVQIRAGPGAWLSGVRIPHIGKS